MLATPWRLLSRCSMRSTHSKIVSLNSRGGMAKDAVEIGLFIRNMEYATLVPTGKVCGSACVYIWAAGKPRGLGQSSGMIAGGMIYVHCPTDKERLQRNECS